MVDFTVNEGPKWVVVGAWLIINIGLFVGIFYQYKNNDEYFYLRELVGDALCWARASAACLNFNCMLVLLPVCRNLLSYIRGACSCCHQHVRRTMDKNITYHKYIAYMICLQTVIHIGAHYFDFEHLQNAHSTGDVREILSSLPTSPNGTWVNPIRSSGSDPTRELFKTVAGVSGVIITICLILIISSSTEIIRRSYFELFWYTHHLFIVFFIGFVVHGVERIIHYQTNIKEHNPESCITQTDKWGVSPCPDPQFEGAGPLSWAWVLGPFILYSIERIIRFIRSLQRVVITKVVNHPSHVFELQMKRKGFWASPGQYVFLHCPSISRLEWHPFTLTSAPHEDHFSVHIRRVGDWTEALAKACRVDEGEFQEAWKMPRLALDGPFGTSSEDFMEYDVGVLIGAGIGVTPFASILKHIWHMHCGSSRRMTLQQVYLYWVCPDMHAFEWFQQLLQSLEAQVSERGDPHFLHHQIYLTRGWDNQQAKNIMLHDRASAADPITGLQQKTHYGRPQWDRVFEQLAEDHRGKKVGVFFCGPGGLSTTLHKLCNRHSSSQGAKFYYNKEHF
ncbi:cytochrome b-245 heavy chain-like [Littorina saxatilis]|uniref:FAD-binding FR-type domain-containing protein n=1 Tax=Littorina saxatilis TaxID=31220 RepID=A0AAN9BLM5_9CAEN